jgi:hypothetical protein
MDRMHTKNKVMSTRTITQIRLLNGKEKIVSAEDKHADQLAGQSMMAAWYAFV